MQLVVKSSSSSIITPLDGTITISISFQNMELIFFYLVMYIDGIIPIHTNGDIDYSRTFRIFIVEKNFDVFVVWKVLGNFKWRRVDHDLWFANEKLNSVQPGIQN